MTKLTNFFSSLVLLAMGGFIFSSCTQATTSITTNPPSDLTAMATGPSTIVVHWIRDPADVGADTIIATDTVTGSKIAPVIVPPTATPDTMGTLTGLDTGVTYTISVHSTTSISSTIVIMTNPPNGLVALSLDSDSISVSWLRSQGDASADTIIVTSAGNSPMSIVVPAPSAGPISIPGLSENTVYSISIHSTSGTTNAAQPNFSWMTAERATGIRIYETNDTILTAPKALILGTHNTHSAPLSGLTNADFVLESVTDSGSGISLVSGKVYNPSWTDATGIDPDSNYIEEGIDGESLNGNYRSTNYQAEQARSLPPYGANSYNIPNDNNEGTQGYHRVLITTTINGNLALIEIVPDPVTYLPYSTDTTLNPSGAANKYITVNVSYQSAQNEPYAARGRSGSSSWPMKRISAH